MKISYCNAIRYGPAEGKLKELTGPVVSLRGWGWGGGCCPLSGVSRFSITGKAKHPTSNASYKLAVFDLS